MTVQSQVIDGSRCFTLEAEAKVPFQPAFKYVLNSKWNMDGDRPFLETYSQWSENKGEEILRRDSGNDTFTYEAAKPGKISETREFTDMPESDDFVDPLSLVFGLQVLDQPTWNVDLISFSKPGSLKLSFGERETTPVECFGEARELTTVEMEVNGKSLGDRFRLLMDVESKLVCTVGYKLPVIGTIGIEATRFESRDR